MNQSACAMEAVLEWDNLMNAFHNAAKGKADRKEVIAFRKNLDRNIFALQKDLENLTMAFGRYSFFRIHDPKTRDICAAAFRERVAHHALINVCGPVLDHCQIRHSYACRKGKGQHRALKTASQWACHHEFFLKMDVARFFDTVDHAVLKKMLAGKIRDAKARALFSKIIDSYESVPGKGLPLGNLTSQYFANFYLTGFDHWIIQSTGAGRYLRYMDDMVVFADRLDLKKLSNEIEYYLDANLKLRLKPNHQINRTENGLGFLGAVVYPGRLRLSQAAKRRVSRKFKARETAFQKEIISEKDLAHGVQSLWAGLCHTQSRGWRKNLAVKSRIA
ncbi:RNA-directed DNA polymerase [uncultured Desulfobacter sp.]|uniref:RNA-directed DNA polymerase n=1 Tax=uncultured Desulfobacter sp. TaxID=240139 RepID=UPI002AAAD3CB|nr:RNA-directed DNA polymerase [uncultured Desulfobacter sp.]